MNVRRLRAIASLMASALPSAAFAQVDGVFIMKRVEYVQAGAADTALRQDTPPFKFRPNVYGQGIAPPFPAPIIDGPITLGEPWHNMGVMGYWADDARWHYGFPNFRGWSAGSKDELDALFGEGVYSFNVLGFIVQLDFSGDRYPVVPMAEIVGGVWRCGEYVVAPDVEVLISTNEHLEWGITAAEAISLNLEGPGYAAGDGRTRLPGEDPGPPAFLTLAVPAGALLPGERYQLDLEFTASSDALTDVPGFPDAFAAAAFANETRVIIRVSRPCPADHTNDGLLDFFDVQAFLNAYASHDPSADLNNDCLFDFFDVQTYLNSYSAGCP